LSTQKRSVKDLNGAAKAAFAVGYSWAFACRIRIRVKGLRVNVKDPALKVKDCHLKVKAFHGFPQSSCPHKKRSVNELIGAAKAAFAVGNSWALARRIRK